MNVLIVELMDPAKGVSQTIVELVTECLAATEKVASTTTLPAKMAPSASNAMAFSLSPGTLISKTSSKPSLKIPGVIEAEHGKVTVPAEME